ncbi:ninjurin-2-like [Culicoides brevitarsis]|uniref:ninjurin-2-like n=1 Tax=Culicoides brevitarsis TaxID=469753 RepID=UPI00307B26B4
MSNEQPKNAAVEERKVERRQSITSQLSIQEITDKLKKMDINSFATRKSLAQGMLDLALLTANAAQLKYILTLGPRYQFYQLLLVLIAASIGLQVLQAIIILVLGILFDINKPEQQRRAEKINNVLVSITVLTVVINVIISAFDIKDATNYIQLKTSDEDTSH